MDCLTGLLLWRGGTVEFDWWDRIRKKLSSSSFLLRRRQACTGYIQPGLGPLSSLLWCLFSLALTSSCWTVTACQLHSSKQLIYGRKHISQDFRQGLEKVYLRSTPCTGSVTLLTARMLSTRNTGLMPIGRDKVSCLSLSLNAGLVVIFSSSHPPLFDWADWTRRCRRLPDTEFDSLLATATETVEQAFLGLLTGFLHRTLSSQDLTQQEMQYWIQSGLALSPLVATCTQYSVDFCLAWALIGEWTSRILFPVPKGPWPRHGHAGVLLKAYQARSPRIVA